MKLSTCESCQELLRKLDQAQRDAYWQYSRAESKERELSTCRKRVGKYYHMLSAEGKAKADADL